MLTSGSAQVDQASSDRPSRHSGALVAVGDPDPWVWPAPTGGRSYARAAARRASGETKESETPARTKVLHVITKFFDGAGGNTLLSAQGADPARYEVWVAGAEGGPLWQRAEESGIRTVKLAHMRGALSPLHDVRAVVELARLMRRERFDIVHTHSSKAGFVGRVAAWLCRTPAIVHTIHGFSWHDYMSRSRRWSYLGLELLARPLTDAFLAVAPSVAREAVETRIAPSYSVRVVPSAVALDEIPDTPDEGVRDELGVEPGTRVVGTVGRFDFQKAPLDFVRMAALVSGTHPGTRFVMVGEGELHEAAREEARRLGVDITFLGYRPDAARVAASFDVYVVSSLYEGLGRALCEALASGRPVVATAVNGVVDVVEAGATGLLARSADPADLARHVTWLLDHPDDARRIGDAGRARVRALFHPALMCQLIDETYETLLGGRHARD